MMRSSFLLAAVALTVTACSSSVEEQGNSAAAEVDTNHLARRQQAALAAEEVLDAPSIGESISYSTKRTGLERYMITFKEQGYVVNVSRTEHADINIAVHLGSEDGHPSVAGIAFSQTGSKPPGRSFYNTSDLGGMLSDALRDAETALTNGEITYPAVSIGDYDACKLLALAIWSKPTGAVSYPSDDCSVPNRICAGDPSAGPTGFDALTLDPTAVDARFAACSGS